MAARVTASTPEPRLDALLSCAAAELDGTWYPPCLRPRHDGLERALPRLVHDLRQHDLRMARPGQGGGPFYLGSQVKESNKTRPKADPAQAVVHRASRFPLLSVPVASCKHQYMYDMQSQFFDQLVYEWRWTADPELERLLRPALELHLQWARDCFDPDGDGLYESYINTMPTDSVWYNGGASAEETAFVYRGHQAALDMARRAGDATRPRIHAATLRRSGMRFWRGCGSRAKAIPASIASRAATAACTKTPGSTASACRSRQGC